MTCITLPWLKTKQKERLEEKRIDFHRILVALILTQATFPFTDDEFVQRSNRAKLSMKMLNIRETTINNQLVDVTIMTTKEVENSKLADLEKVKTMSEELKGLEGEELRDKEEKVVKYIGTDLHYTHQIQWTGVLTITLLHLFGIVGLYKVLTGQVMWKTILWSCFLICLSTEGSLIGAHRYYSHLSFKASRVFEIILLVAQTLSGQNSAFVWARDHRQHHRFSDTDGDPHNSKRGFFYSHVGWIMCKRHPICRELRKTIDISDLLENKLVMFQYKHFLPLYFLIGFLMPVVLTIWWFNESVSNAILVSYFLRYMLSQNFHWLINSAAHKFGNRPYDKSIQPVESAITSLLTLGEGWHNYHHAFPWDYKAAELPMPFNISAQVIEFMEKINLASDLKSVPTEMLEKRMHRCGDGTEPLKPKLGLTTAIGPVHPMNPSYTVTYPDPEIRVPYSSVTKKTK